MDLNNFEEKLAQNIHENLSAKELAEQIVTAALETEFGKSFTLTAGFAKMVKTLADSIVTNPDLRRPTLSVASLYIEKSRDNKKNFT